MHDALNGLAAYQISAIDLANLRAVEDAPRQVPASSFPARSSGTEAQWTYAGLGNATESSRSIRWTDLVPAPAVWTTHPVRNLLASCAILIAMSFATITGIVSCIRESNPILERVGFWRNAENAANDAALAALRQVPTSVPDQASSGPESVRQLLSKPLDLQ